MPDNRDERDELADWLNGPLRPLPPPPGTFELIKRRARRRKLRRLAITVASAAAVITAAVAIPQVVPLHITGPPAPAARQAANGSRSATSGTPQVNGRGTPAAAGPGTASPAGTAPAGAAPVPPDFAPQSVTFIGPHTGWVIGQAGTPGHCATRYCTSVARTGDAGQTWTGVPAPLAGPPDGGTGVSGIRFLNASDGWAFGPELWATHDGGQTWTRIPTGGQRVTDLETAGSRAFALFATCTGTGAAFAAGCTSFTLYSAAASGGSWAPVGPATTGLGAGGADTSAALTLAGTRGYLLAPDGTLFAGPVDGSASWQRLPAAAGAPSCTPGAAQDDGQPSGELLAAATAASPALLCARPSAAELFEASGAAGAAAPSWAGAVPVPAPGGVTSLADAPDGTVVLATGQGIAVWQPAAGGSGWRQATLAGGAPAGGFGYVGMTSDAQGIALPADTALHEIWLTFDGCASWQAYPVAG